MSEYATQGAMLTCTYGAAPSQLMVTANTLLSVQGNMVATTSDKVPITNIAPFGTCTMKPSPGGHLPCVPATMAWTGFLTSVQVPGGNPLLNTSMIMCACGGCIKFQNSGQMKPQKVVLNPSSCQIDTLKIAAQNGTPFCEECEKRKEEKNPRILRLFWMDENKEFKTLSELAPGQEVTLCVEVEEGGVGEKVMVEIEDNLGKKFKGRKKTLKFSDLLIEEDNTAYIDNFKYEYEEENL